MTEVIIYTTKHCPYCIRAKNLLEKKAATYTEYRVDLDPELRREMEQRANRTSVPQIFINGFHVGGFDDMFMLDLDGKLDELLHPTTS